MRDILNLHTDSNPDNFQALLGHDTAREAGTGPR